VRAFIIEKQIKLEKCCQYLDVYFLIKCYYIIFYSHVSGKLVARFPVDFTVQAKCATFYLLIPSVLLKTSVLGNKPWNHVFIVVYIRHELWSEYV